MKPRSSKNKGRLLQNAVRDKLLETFPKLQPDDVRSTGMGQTGEDIQLSPAAREVFPYQVECKSKAASQIHTYYEQAKTHGTHEPLVIVKKNRSITLAIVSLDHFLELQKGRNNGN